MFALKSPYAQVTLPNPVFATGLEQVRLLRTSRSLIRYTMLIILIPVVMLTTWWLLTAVRYAQAQRLQRWDIYTNFQNVESALAIALLFLTPILVLVVDVYTIGVTVNSIGHERQPNPTAYIAAKYALAQVKAWRVLALEIAVRIFSVFLVLMAFTYTDNCFIGDNPPLSDTCGVSFMPFHMDVLMVILLCSIAGLGVLYILEPLWRMRVLAAMGLLISAGIHKLALAWLSALAAIIGVHLVQVMLIVAVFECFQIAQGLVFGIAVVVAAIAMLVFLYRKAHNTAFTLLSRIVHSMQRN